MEDDLSPFACLDVDEPAAAPKPKRFGGRWRDKVVHCRKAPFDVYVGRKSGGAPAGATGEWGNPFAMRGEGDRQRVIEQYAEWLRSQPELCARARRELRGKVLGCWCAPLACHGHVLAEVANSPGPEDHLLAVGATAVFSSQSKDADDLGIGRADWRKVLSNFFPCQLEIGRKRYSI